MQPDESWSGKLPVPEYVLKDARKLREIFLEDPYRPYYHFCVIDGNGVPGDPNGAFWHNGRYHLMYLYKKAGSGGFCWGHVSSADLLHWRHHPDAIGPGNGDEGCFSGGAFVDDDGTAYLSYWMLWGAKGIGIAKSNDPNFETWTKLPENPVCISTEFGITDLPKPDGSRLVYGTQDPSNIWKHNGKYYMLTGNGPLLWSDKYGLRGRSSNPAWQGDHLYLFESNDLKTWTYLHEFYERNPKWTENTEDNSCPSFLPLPSSPNGGQPSGKHLLLFISHNKGYQYYIGNYENNQFIPDNHGRMSWVDNTFFAPEALIDGKGRQIAWVWLLDNTSNDMHRGWSGVYAIPRSLWLGEDGTLRQAPVSEIKNLRMKQFDWNNLKLKANQTQKLDGFHQDCCEIYLETPYDCAGNFKLNVKASPDQKELTALSFDKQNNRLVFDASKSGKEGRPVVEHAPFVLNDGEPLKLRIFIDKCVVELFANDRQAISRRVYPFNRDSNHIEIIATGEVAFTTLNAWELAPTNPY